MGEGALGIIEERVRKREEYLEGARGFAECVLRRLSNSTIIVYGSVARGDYNEWSDVDVLIITADEIPTKPVERLETLYECLKNNPLIEPVVITYQEFTKLLTKKNPLVVEALERGVFLVDKLSVLRTHVRKS